MRKKKRNREERYTKGKISMAGSSPASSSSSSGIGLGLPLPLSTLIQYAVISVVVYILAGAPSLGVFSGSSSSSSSSSSSYSSSHSGGVANSKQKSGFQGDKLETLIHPNRTLDCKELGLEHEYKMHVFSREPLVVYIEGFLSEGERRRVVELR
ncbi:hypothetical protein K491DRAFT_429425 [Lophiostoma macrostomum CBS 122681]|uniref:Uncharacterized protein n=1 Tax=Lophiostoma macrostomum CBS 122681 TaxID=1314788 RepID=A0A6A6T9R9_9PLEO|nr:hypothetical protein K491DRAFT_429425 [Lophiostoma macrostomum CBS 122681]